jgi:hypothetical protein
MLDQAQRSIGFWNFQRFSQRLMYCGNDGFGFCDPSPARVAISVLGIRAQAALAGGRASTE